MGSAGEAPLMKQAPARIFLSYKRNVEPDQPLALKVMQSLSSQGHDVFIDQVLTVGQEWAREIEQQVRQADYLVVFLSAASSHSEMVKGEIEIARDQAAKSGGKPRVLPVRVEFDSSLPYPLNAYLDKIQYVHWRDESDTVKLLQQLEAALSGSTTFEPSSGAPPPAAIAGRQPVYAAPLPPPGGALDLEDSWYVTRDSDQTALSLIRQRGQTLIIKGPRQMGKSSLLVRVVAEAMNAKKQVALLDFQLLDQETKASSDLFFQRFADSIAEALAYPDAIGGFWDPKISGPQNCGRYLERQILNKLDGGLVLAIDEAESMFEAEFSEDFFGMIRSWHNNRANPTKRAWKKLDVVLVTSSEPYMFIKSQHQSPFNVGMTLRLEDFQPAQMQTLNEFHGSPLSSRELARLTELLSGHPYLTRKALYAVAGQVPRVTADELFRLATDDAGPFGDHLRYYLLRIQGMPDLKDALLRICQDQDCEDEMLIYRLESAGLVKQQARKVIPRCQLYAEYFRDRLNPHD